MGTDELAGRLGSRVLFVPWGAESVTCAAELALELRDETHARGLVVVDQLTVVPDELAAWPHRTLRTRTPVDGADVVAIIRPSYDLLAGLRLPEEVSRSLRRTPATRCAGGHSSSVPAT